MKNKNLNLFAKLVSKTQILDLKSQTAVKGGLCEPPPMDDNSGISEPPPMDF